jgi:hypothetical protein
MDQDIKKHQLEEYRKTHPNTKEGSRSFHKPKNPESILLRKKLIYQYYKQGYGVKDIQRIFYNSSEHKIKEIIEEMKKASKDLTL